MGSFHVVNVVHAEHDWWDDGYRGIDRGATRLLSEFRSIEDTAGKPIRITWCAHFGNGMVGRHGRPIPDLIDERPAFFEQRRAAGDEVGLHTHAPRAEDQHSHIAANADRLAQRGFGRPRTFAPGWFHVDLETYRALEAAGIEICAGLIVRGQAWRDDSDHRSFRPFHPSRTAIGKDGDSPVIELPLFLSQHGLADDPQGFIRGFRAQWERRAEVPMDVVHFSWHPFDLMDPATGQVSERSITAFATLFRELATWPELAFSTASAAIGEWKASLTGAGVRQALPPTSSPSRNEAR